MAAYQINRFNKALLTSVEEGTIDRTTDLKFIGKNYVGYGEVQNENFLFLLENFAGAQQPPRAISGQVWYDSSSNKLKVFDGQKFRTTNGLEVGDTAPTDPQEGNFWWDSANSQLYVYDGSNFILVGPQDTAGAGVTQMKSVAVTDTSDVTHYIIKGIINDAVVFLISNTEFVLSNKDSVTGFPVVKKGLTLVNTGSDGISTNDYVYWGSASNALQLNGVDSSEYVLSSTPVFTNTTQAAQFDEMGLKIGSAGYVYVEPQNQLVVENPVGGSINFKTYNDSTQQVTHTATITSSGINPAVSGSADLGSEENKWGTVYANVFEGLSTSSETITLSAIEYRPSLSAVRNTLPLRDSSGDITANEFRGVATSAKYADLAEVYETDEDYPVGTVVAVGGEKEVRLASFGNIAIGVISEAPAYLMNSESDGQAVGLKGRVPVRVIGPVEKGQPVYVHQDGVASTMASSSIVGISLENNDSPHEKLVECVLKV